MRHHLQNTCRKQAHILLNAKPIKLQITAPGPRGARWPRVAWTSVWVYRPPMGPRVAHGWVLRCWAGSRCCAPWGAGSRVTEGAQSEES